MWISNFDDLFNGGFGDVRRLQRDINRLFRGYDSVDEGDGWPTVKVRSNTEGATLSLEVPAIEPKELEITVVGKSITIKGERKAEPLAENERYLRRERFSGSFTRSVALPFAVNSEQVEARYKDGVLTIVAPRAEQDRPRKIEVQ